MIYLASDHAGFALKEFLKKFLMVEGCDLKDFGAFKYQAKDDYPDFIKLAAKAVAKDKNSQAIIFGGSGQGEAMTANRFKGVRAAVYYGGPLTIVSLSKEHNQANILSLGARFVTKRQAKQAVQLWLGVKFSQAPRHLRRLKKIDQLS